MQRTCVKRGYKTERDALDMKRKIKRAQGKKNLRVYKCPYCPWYHLTHQVQKKRLNR